MRVSISVVLYQKTLSNNENPLAIRLTKDGKRKYLRLGISLLPQYWDNLKNKPKINCPNREYIEGVITEKLSKYQKQALEFQTISKEFSLTQLIAAVDKPMKSITVEKYLENIVERLTKEKRIGNAEHYKSLLKSLQKFTRLSQTLFVDIDSSFLNKYETFMREKGNKGNTISIKMRTLKATYNQAIKDNIIKKDYFPFNDYNVSKLKEETVKRAITKEDIQNILNFDVTTITKRPQSLIQFSKDLFLFSYFGCGINMVDMAYLKKENIISGRIAYRRQKTNKPISFLLNQYALDILKKYEQENSKYLFPILDNSVHITVEQQIE